MQDEEKQRGGRNGDGRDAGDGVGHAAGKHGFTPLHATFRIPIWQLPLAAEDFTVIKLHRARPDTVHSPAAIHYPARRPARAAHRAVGRRRRRERTRGPAKPQWQTLQNRVDERGERVARPWACVGVAWRLVAAAAAVAALAERNMQ